MALVAKIRKSRIRTACLASLLAKSPQMRRYLPGGGGTQVEMKKVFEEEKLIEVRMFSDERDEDLGLLSVDDAKKDDVNVSWNGREIWVLTTKGEAIARALAEVVSADTQSNGGEKKKELPAIATCREDVASAVRLLLSRPQFIRILAAIVESPRLPMDMKASRLFTGKTMDAVRIAFTKELLMVSKPISETDGKLIEHRSDITAVTRSKLTVWEALPRGIATLQEITRLFAELDLNAHEVAKLQLKPSWIKVLMYFYQNQLDKTLTTSMKGIVSGTLHSIGDEMREAGLITIRPSNEQDADLMRDLPEKSTFTVVRNVWEPTEEGQKAMRVCALRDSVKDAKSPEDNGGGTSRGTGTGTGNNSSNGTGVGDIMGGWEARLAREATATANLHLERQNLTTGHLEILITVDRLDGRCQMRSLLSSNLHGVTDDTHRDQLLNDLKTSGYITIGKKFIKIVKAKRSVWANA